MSKFLEPHICQNSGSLCVGKVGASPSIAICLPIPRFAIWLRRKYFALRLYKFQICPSVVIGYSFVPMICVEENQSPWRRPFVTTLFPIFPLPNSSFVEFLSLIRHVLNPSKTYLEFICFPPLLLRDRSTPPKNNWALSLLRLIFSLAATYIFLVFPIPFCFIVLYCSPVEKCPENVLQTLLSAPALFLELYVVLYL